VNLERRMRSSEEKKGSGRFFLSGTVRKIVPTPFLVLVLAAPAVAQTPTVRRVDFDEAVKQALERNPSIAGAAVAVAQAEANRQQARALTRPGIAASMTTLTNSQQVAFEEAGVVSPRTQVSLGARAEAPLLVAPQWAAVGQAGDQIAVANQNSAEIRRQVALAAAQAYLTVIAAQRQVEVDLRALENARAHLEYADRRLEGGVGSRLNQLRAAQAVSDNETRLETARLLLSRAQETLGVQMAENGPVDAASVPQLEVPTTPSVEELVQNRPDVKTQILAVRAADRVLRDTNKEWFPTASVSFDPQYITPSGLFQPARSWRLVFAVSQPLFDTNVGARRVLRTVALDRIRVDQTAVEIQARSEIRIAQESIRAFDRAMASSRLGAQQAAEVLKISTAAFEVGATTNIEVIDAQRSARDADTTAALSEDAWRRAQLELLVAIGRFPQ
jgi:outer membrane protein TolC